MTYMESKYVNETDLNFLSTIEDGKVDLVLTDPPYIISKTSGMQKHKDSEDEHQVSKLKKPKEVSTLYGKKIIDKFDHGKKFAVATDFGEWDKGYTIDDLEKVIKEFYRILRDGGSCIIFFNVWKIETLSDLLKEYKFTKLRLIEWIKTNPMPINQKATYLSNAKEMAISCVKGGKATFNSQYDRGVYRFIDSSEGFEYTDIENGVYEYPIYAGKDRLHPTQKSLPLFEELIEKHSNEGDSIVDPYGGSATTYVASTNKNRICLSCEPDEEYYKKSLERIKKS